MSKTTFFFGQSVFGQLISLIEPSIITNACKACDSDRYVKRFKTKDHLDKYGILCFSKVLLTSRGVWCHVRTVGQNKTFSNGPYT